MIQIRIKGSRVGSPLDEKGGRGRVTPPPPRVIRNTVAALNDLEICRLTAVPCNTTRGGKENLPKNPAKTRLSIRPHLVPYHHFPRGDNLPSLSIADISEMAKENLANSSDDEEEEERNFTLDAFFLHEWMRRRASAYQKHNLPVEGVLTRVHPVRRHSLQCQIPPGHPVHFSPKHGMDDYVMGRCS